MGIRVNKTWPHMCRCGHNELHHGLCRESDDCCDCNCPRFRRDTSMDIPRVYVVERRSKRRYANWHVFSAQPKKTWANKEMKYWRNIGGNYLYRVVPYECAVMVRY